MSDITALYLIASGSLHILTHVLVGKAEHKDKEMMIWHGKPINHDLEKALRRSFLSAQQTIAIDCQQVEKNNPWLKQRITEIANELKGCSPSNEFPKKREQLFNSLNDLLAFLTVNTQLAEELNQDSLKDQLIGFALLGCKDAPECYKAKIEDRLFNEVRDYFIREIKQNEPVHNILMASSQAEMFAKINRLERGQEEIVKLLTELRDFKATTSWQAKMKLDIDLASNLFDDQILEIINTMRQQGLRTLRIEAGSVVMVLEGSKKDIKQLETLFKSGQLNEIVGIPVKEIRVTSASTNPPTLIKLNQWLIGIFEEGWQTIETVFDTQNIVPTFGFPRGAKVIRRAKVLDFNDQTVAVIIMIPEIVSDSMKIQVQIRSIGEKKLLPQYLQLRLEIDLESEESKVDKVIDVLDLEFTGHPGELFRVQVALENTIFTEDFVI
jgi:hypothetical protein